MTSEETGAAPVNIVMCSLCLFSFSSAHSLNTQKSLEQLHSWKSLRSLAHFCSTYTDGITLSSARWPWKLNAQKHKLVTETSSAVWQHIKQVAPELGYTAFDYLLSHPDDGTSGDILRVFRQIGNGSLRAAEDAVRPVSRASLWTAKCGSVSLKKSDFMTRHQNTIRFLLAE